MSNGSLLLDIDGFYDHCDIVKTYRAAIALDFPAIPLALEMLVHISVRFLRDEGMHSREIQPHRSIIAGISGANDFARCLLYDILETSHNNYPSVNVRTWVDDANARTEGTPFSVSHSLAKVGVELTSNCNSLGFSLADK